MENAGRPGVVVWFKVYCWFLAAMYFFVMLMAIPFLVLSPEDLEMDAIEAKIMGAVFVLTGLPLLVAFLLGVFLRPRPWVWVYSLVLICIGMTSACFLPACIPLLIFWIKDQTKRYYGRQSTVSGNQ